MVLAIGITIRVVVSFFSVMHGDLNVRERLFVAFAWLPKATVQAAIGGVAFDAAMKLPDDDPRKTEFLRLGAMVLTIAVLVILITAPIGAVAIMLSAPRMLKKSGDEASEKNGIENEPGEA
jgi:NhaP-type Na+/H+ or K+/H+ antiporter